MNPALVVRRAHRALLLVHLVLALVAMVVWPVGVWLLMRTAPTDAVELWVFVAINAGLAVAFAGSVARLAVAARRAPTHYDAAPYSIGLAFLTLALDLVPALVALRADGPWPLVGAVVLAAPPALLVTSAPGLLRPARPA